MTQLLNPYCTLEDVQNETRNTDSEEYDWMYTCINAASRAIDTYCRRDFLLHDHTTNTLAVPEDWMAQNVLYLPFPVIALTVVQIGDQVLTVDDDYRVETDPFSGVAKLVKQGRWLPPDAYRRDILNSDRMFPLRNQVMLTGKFGYLPDPTLGNQAPPVGLPSEITEACTRYAAIRTGLSRREVVGLDGQRQQITDRKLPAEVTAILDRWRIQLV